MGKRTIMTPMNLAFKLVVNALVLLPMLTVVSAVNAAEPQQPSDLRHTVYSSTAAEIFWNRAVDDGIVIGYEIQLNNLVLGQRDALSYFNASLTPGQKYTVSVVSIDDEGLRSPAASISFIGGDFSNTVVATTDGSESGEENAVDDAGLVVDGSDVDDNSAQVITGLTASLYSSTSVELFWERPVLPGYLYEINRNGDVVATIDGISYYDNKLVSTTQYDFKIVAIAPSGERSTPVSISVQPGSFGSNASSGTTPPDTVPDEPTTPVSPLLAAPTGTSAAVYSSKTIELFWDRSSVFGLVYEVSRDGSLVRTTDGTSFYESQLKPGTTYIYDVVAVTPANQRSSPAVITVKTLGATSEVTPDQTELPDPEDVPTVPPNAMTSLVSEPFGYYQQDGYGQLDVLRVDLKTVIGSGPCDVDDQSGCTLADVLADIDKTDDLTVDINVHFQSDDFADDGSISNAELRMRGGGSRFAPQKSFRIKLDDKKILWRGERHLQLNKHPFDLRRMRNKVAMDAMSDIPNLPSTRTQFVNLWIDNGEGPVDYGLFTHVERVNENYLRNRGWSEDGNMYKAEYFQFSKSDLANLALDEDGEPLDEDLFESTLEIEAGEDHRTLVAMLEALHNPNRSFASVLEQYFDKDNVMAWIAANILLRQNDAVRHNYILYKPDGSEKFHFIPWDYDAALGTWSEPPNDLTNDSLRQRHEYGYALAARNTFLEKFYRQPGIHNEIVAAVENLHQNYVTEASMAERIEHYIDLVAPFQNRAPDKEFNPNFTEYSARQMIGVPGRNLDAIRTRFGVLMAPMLYAPELIATQWRFSWSPAYDVTGAAGSITYRLQVATTPTFDSDSIRIDIGAIEGSEGLITQLVDTDQLPSGEYFARLVATPANEPNRFWQVSANKEYYNNQAYYGARRFVIP